MKMTSFTNNIKGDLNEKKVQVINRLIEIKTSVAIFTSTVIATLYGIYISGDLKIDLFIAFILSAVSLDALSTVFNHIYDYKKAIYKEGYLYNTHNPIVYYKIKPWFYWLIVLILLGIAFLSGIYLVYRTSYLLLLIGAISVLIAILYSAGKNSISYLPISEIISGFFEGSVILMVGSYLQSQAFTMLSFFVSLPIAISIGNIMLANNTVDIEEDKKNKRKTLPIVIGRKKAIEVYIISTCMMYSLTILYVLLNILPRSTWIILLLVPLNFRNIRLFINNQTKSVGFVKALKNSLYFNLMMIAAFLIHLLF